MSNMFVFIFILFTIKFKYIEKFVIHAKVIPAITTKMERRVVVMTRALRDVMVMVKKNV